MKKVQVRGVEIGAGIPKICAPIVGRTIEEIQRQAEMMLEVRPDIVEWRADWYRDVTELKKVQETVQALRSILTEFPILFTFRTAAEGGEQEIDRGLYQDLNRMICESGSVDMIDVELFLGDEVVKAMIRTAHACGVKVVASNHDFRKTPEQSEILRRLCRMQELGADILKIAVMPQEQEDVNTLLHATEEMTRVHADRPVITISMSEKGLVSRLNGEITGSAVTFGTVGSSSAPGQPAVTELRKILQTVHEGRR